MVMQGLAAQALGRGAARSARAALGPLEMRLQAPPSYHCLAPATDSTMHSTAMKIARTTRVSSPAARVAAILRTGLISSTFGLAAWSWAPDAAAQATIKRPGAHPRYSFEAEPHLAIRDNWGHANEAFGPGFRGTVVLVDNGFISSINNSVGLGFGLDWMFLDDDHCHGNPNDRNCHSHSNVVLPLVMQWNFWLHRKWSVFGEPGLAFVFHEDHDDDDFDDDMDLDVDLFTIYAGGRFHFSDTTALTLRFGFPTNVSIGVSFLL